MNNDGQLLSFISTESYLSEWLQLYLTSSTHSMFKKSLTLHMTLIYVCCIVVWPNLIDICQPCHKSNASNFNSDHSPFIAKYFSSRERSWLYSSREQRLPPNVFWLKSQGLWARWLKISLSALQSGLNCTARVVHIYFINFFVFLHFPKLRDLPWG